MVVRENKLPICSFQKNSLQYHFRDHFFQNNATLHLIYAMIITISPSTPPVSLSVPFINPFLSCGLRCQMRITFYVVEI